MAQKTYVIPIFIPHSGCPFQCIFCDQKQISGTSRMPDIDEVKCTADEYLTTIPSTARNVMLAFYGGNFTGLPEKIQYDLLQSVNPYMESKRISAIRVSTRPDCIDCNNLLLLRKWGVTEIELGIQSFDDTVLTESRRGYCSQTAIKASIMIRNYGFTLGHQFMIGLPGDDWGALVKTAQISARLKPDMIRIYPTLVIRDTALADLKNFQPLDFKEACRRSAFLIDFFELICVRILRVGLHPPQDESSIVAGPFHPAFRYMVYSYIWRDFFMSNFSKDFLYDIIDVTTSCEDFSYVVGYKAQNKQLFNQSCKIRPASWLVAGHIILRTSSGTSLTTNRYIYRADKCRQLTARYTSSGDVD